MCGLKKRSSQFATRNGLSDYSEILSISSGGVLGLELALQWFKGLIHDSRMKRLLYSTLFLYSKEVQDARYGIKLVVYVMNGPH